MCAPLVIDSIVSLQNSYVEAPTPNVAAMEDRALKELIEVK